MEEHEENKSKQYSSGTCQHRVIFHFAQKRLREKVPLESMFAADKKTLTASNRLYCRSLMPSDAIQEQQKRASSYD